MDIDPNSNEAVTYLDANASHPILKNVRASLAQALLDNDASFANASSIHRRGQRAKQGLAEFREDLCRFFGRPDGDEFIFVSGATEALNLAIRGFDRERRDQGFHPVFVTSNVEHSAVLDTLNDLSSAPHILPVDSRGQIEVATLVKAVGDALAANDKAQVLVCLQLGNNETGVVFDVDALLGALSENFAPRTQGGGKRTKGQSLALTAQRVYILIDGAQAIGKLYESLVRRALHFADYAVFSAHKCGGLAGVGALWLRRKVPFRPQLTGGVQERKRRAGTANGLGLLSFHLALKEWMNRGEELRAHMAALRQKLYAKLSTIDGLHVHGLGADGSLPGLVNTLNFHVEGCPEESLLLALDLAGFCVSSGSACNSGSLRPSHVILALGYGRDVALSSIRVSLGAESTLSEVLAFAEAVEDKVAQIRAARLYAAEIFGPDNPALEL